MDKKKPPARWPGYNDAQNALYWASFISFCGACVWTSMKPFLWLAEASLYFLGFGLLATFPIYKLLIRWVPALGNRYSRTLADPLFYNQLALLALLSSLVVISNSAFSSRTLLTNYGTAESKYVARSKRRPSYVAKVRLDPSALTAKRNPLVEAVVSQEDYGLVEPGRSKLLLYIDPGLWGFPVVEAYRLMAP